MHIITKFYMDSEPLKQALQLLQQDGRFEIIMINDHKVAINGIVLDLSKLTCKNVDRCLERILDKYKYAAEMPLEVLPISNSEAEELLKRHPELQVFGQEWVRKWGRLKERLAEIAEILRRYRWMVDVVRLRPLDIHPYLVEVYVAVDGEVCLLLNRSKAFCNGKETTLVLRFVGYDRFEDGIKEVYRCCGRRFAKIL